MSGSGQEKPAKRDDQTREERLKSALKANMAKRKAQAKARAGQGAAKNTRTSEQ